MSRRVFAAMAVCAGLAACGGWNPSRPFEREAPAVSEAVIALDGGDAASAAMKLEEYLSTGPCKDGSIGTPDLLARRPDGTFDLGLSLFRVGEQFGRPFGDEEIDAGVSEAMRARRHAQITCARQIVGAIGEDRTAEPEQHARAWYLQGNLAFLDGEYEEAVRAYDRALVVEPAEAEAGDSIGRDAAWNRAIALRRIDDAKDAGSPDARPDGGDASPPADAGGDGGDHPPKDAGRGADSSDDRRDSGEDSQRDAASQPPAQPDASDSRPEAGAPPLGDQDDRMLDQLENAPTLQQEEAKRFGKKRVRGMADK
ncbi:MAG TPA: tetratricopeptide repeat protein [Polyangiaceae bacterium]|nr:tetratricopeptide repeat protein [Polyangiaceae bacterium]